VDRGGCVPIRDGRIPSNILDSDLTEEQIEQARVTVSRGARDVEDLALLLDMLGLLPKEEDATSDAREIRKRKAAELKATRKAARRAKREQEVAWLQRNDY
jgi:hypothetical protein